MRAAAVISFIGAAAPVLASVQSGQLHEPVAVAVAVAVRHVDGAVCDVEATSNIDGQATPEPVVISDSEPKAKSWTEINTTVTVGAGSWSANTTNTPVTPLPTEEADTTDSEPSEVTGGALPQPMKASAAGLLGFFIMSLVML